MLSELWGSDLLFGFYVAKSTVSQAKGYKRINWIAQHKLEKQNPVSVLLKRGFV
jgi:hypothetical protein